MPQFPRCHHDDHESPPKNFSLGLTFTHTLTYLPTAHTRDEAWKGATVGVQGEACILGSAYRLHTDTTAFVGTFFINLGE